MNTYYFCFLSKWRIIFYRTWGSSKRIPGGVGNKISYIIASEMVQGEGLGKFEDPNRVGTKKG